VEKGEGNQTTPYGSVREARVALEQGGFPPEGEDYEEDYIMDHMSFDGDVSLFRLWRSSSLKG